MSHQNKSDPISLIFMAYNEVQTIEQEIISFYQSIVEKIPGSEFIIAEDGSTDGTSEIIKKLQTQIGITHLTSEKRLGYSQAFLRAVNSTKNNWIFFSDTGLKHNPKDFWNLYHKRHQYDLIIGRKTNRTDQYYRRFFTWGLNFIIRNYFNIKDLYDCDSGFKIFNKQVVHRIFNSEKLFFTELPASEIAIRSHFEGFKYTEVPVTYNKRQGFSRGLPPNKIPKVILGTFKNLYRLKKEIILNR